MKTATGRSRGAEIIAYVRNQLKPNFAPRDLSAERVEPRYSDTNLQLLIDIIEQVTGKGFAAVLAEEILGPLGLQQTNLAGHPRTITRRPAGLWVGDQQLERPLFLESCRDFYSTVGDLIKFMRALVRGPLFEQPTTYPLMTGRFHRFGFSLSPAALRAPQWPLAYGLGVMRFEMPRPFALFSPMPPVIGHTGVPGSWLFYCAGNIGQLAGAHVPFRVVPRILRLVERVERNRT